jgi:hypothetical protein
MRGEGWLEPADVRFGVALPDAWGDFAAPMGLGGTVELPLEAVEGRGGGAADLAAGGLAARTLAARSFAQRTFAQRTFAKALPAGADLCLRLGPDFVGPALGGPAVAVPAAAERAESVEAAYLLAVAACRRAAGDPALRGRVAAYLLEFPESIHYGPASRRHLDRVLRDLAGLPLAVAFYGADWYSVRVVEGLKERGAALCLLDLPPGPASLPSIDVATAPLVYVKCWGAGPPEAWMPRLEALALSAERLRVLVAARGPGDEDAAAAAGQAFAMWDAWTRRAEATASAAGESPAPAPARPPTSPEGGS